MEKLLGPAVHHLLHSQGAHGVGSDEGIPQAHNFHIGEGGLVFLGPH